MPIIRPSGVPRPEFEVEPRDEDLADRGENDYGDPQTWSFRPEYKDLSCGESSRMGTCSPNARWCMTLG